MKKKVTQYKDPGTFFEKLLKDPEIRVHFEKEHAKTQIAMAVKATRKKAKLTQAQLARKVGTTQSVIARLESGEDSRTPSLDLLARIASACDSTLEIGFLKAI